MARQSQPQSNASYNDERTVMCPINECEAEKLARGIHLHIRQSAGGGHGPSGEVPDHVDLDELETVGTQEVKMDYPDTRYTETDLRLCPYCSDPFQGLQGVSIHLGQVAGQGDHPAKSEIDLGDEEVPRVEVNRHGELTQFVDDVETSRQVYDLVEEVRRHQA